MSESQRHSPRKGINGGEEGVQLFKNGSKHMQNQDVDDEHSTGPSGKARKLNNNKKVAAKLEKVLNGDRTRKANQGGSMSSHRASHHGSQSVRSIVSNPCGIVRGGQLSSGKDIDYDKYDEINQSNLPQEVERSQQENNDSDIGSILNDMLREVRSSSVKVGRMEQMLKKYEMEKCHMFLTFQSMISLIQRSNPCLNRDDLLSPIERIFAGKFYNSLFSRTIMNIICLLYTSDAADD